MIKGSLFLFVSNTIAEKSEVESYNNNLKEA